MATWTFSDIKQGVRLLTGRFTPAEITNEVMGKKINQFYQLIFPAEVKLEEKHVYYEFLTTENQAYYDLPSSTFTNFEPPVTANLLEMSWYQNTHTFQSQNPRQYTFLKPWTGDNSTTVFTTSVTGFPIFPGSVTITDNTETFQDLNTDWTNGITNVTGSLGGSLDITYSTGLINVTFNTAPSTGHLIYLNYSVFSAGRPISILMYNNQFELFPPPDQSYVIRMGAYSVVKPLVKATDTPDLNEWGPCIVYGTARAILADYGELDGYAEVTALYKEQVAYVLTRTNQTLLNVRSIPSF